MTKSSRGTAGKIGEKLTWLVGISGLVCVACQPSGGETRRLDTMQQPGIVAGPGEKTFTEQHNVKVMLPMAEVDFLGILTKLGLRYRVCGDRSLGQSLPPARHSPNIDLSSAQRCYDIYGNKLPGKYGEAWRAFVNDRNQIFYLENTFAYTGA